MRCEEPGQTNENEQRGGTVLKAEELREQLETLSNGFMTDQVNSKQAMFMVNTLICICLIELLKRKDGDT